MTGPIDKTPKHQASQGAGGNNPAPKAQRRTVNFQNQDYAVYERGELLVALANREKLDHVYIAPGTDLSGINFGDLNLDLQHIIFDRVNLSGTIFNGNCKVRDSLFYDCNLNNTQFNGTRLSRTRFQKISKAEKISFNNTILIGAAFREFKSNSASFYNSNLGDASFKNCFLNNASMKGVVANSCLFDHTEMNRVKFQEDANLVYAKFFDVKMNGIDFKASSLQGTKFRRAEGLRANFNGAQMQFSSFLGGSNKINKSYFAETNFDNADLSGLKTEGCNFDKASFIETIMHGTAFKKATMHEVTLDRADIKDADMGKAELKKAKANGLNLENVNLNGGSLEDASFNNCIFKDVSLHGANGRKVKFKQASSLRNVDFSSNDKHGKTELKRSYFQGGNLISCDFTDTNLEEAGFVDNIELKNCIFKGAHLLNAFFSHAVIKLSSFIGAILKRTDMRNNEFREIQWEDPSNTDFPVKIGLNGRWYQEIKNTSRAIQAHCRFTDSVETRYKK